MYYTPRTIAFLVEFLHPPLPPDPGQIQRIHNRLFESPRPDYQSFTVNGDRSVLSNPVAQPGAVSSAAFLQDRIQFREEFSGLSVDEFVERVGRITGLVLSERPIQVFTGIVVTIRSLVNPREYRDSRTYLSEGVFGFEDQLATLGRTPQLFGMRLVFPPTQEEQHAFALRIESYANDPRSIFLENQGTFGPLVVAAGLEGITGHIQSTYDFLTERALPFLGHFDQRQNA